MPILFQFLDNFYPLCLLPYLGYALNYIANLKVSCVVILALVFMLMNVANMLISLRYHNFLIGIWKVLAVQDTLCLTCSLVITCMTPELLKI